MFEFRASIVLFEDVFDAVLGFISSFGRKQDVYF